MTIVGGFILCAIVLGICGGMLLWLKWRSS